MQRHFLAVGLAIFLVALAGLTGCHFFGLVPDQESGLLATAPTTGNAQVAFRLILPPPAGGKAPIPLADIRPSLLSDVGATSAKATFRLILANPGNRSHPSDLFAKVVPVSATGSVAVSFPGLPARPVVAQLRIDGGHIQGWTDFHGAADLRAGDNVLELSPMGSGLFSDLLGSLIERTIQSPDLVEMAGTNLVTQAQSAMQSVPGLTPATLDEAFDRIVDQLKPTGYVSLVPSSDRGALIGFGGTQKLWEKKNADLWQTGELYSANPADILVYKILFQGVGGLGYVAWKHSTSSSFGIVRLDAPTGNRASYCRNPGLCDHALVLADGSIVVGGRNEEKGCPVIFRWSGAANASTWSAAAAEQGLQWVRYLTAIGTGTINASTAIRGLQFDGQDTILATVYDGVTNATRTFRLLAADGTGEAAFTGAVTNTPPTVVLSNPKDGAVIKAGDDIALTADASDADGNVLRVEFFQGQTRIGVATAAPYVCILKNPAIGSFTVTATAVDNGLAARTSTPIRIVINASGLEADSPYAPLDVTKIVSNPQDKSLLIRDEIIVTFKTPPSAAEVGKVAARMGGTVIASFPSIKTWQFQIPSTEVNTVLNSVNSLQSESLTSNLGYHYDTHQVIQSVSTPNDPYFAQNWGLPKIQGVDAGDLPILDQVEVAVVDTGVRRDHEDLIAAIDAKNSRNFTSDNGGDPLDFADGHGHGTHVAGIIAAARNNEIGLCGVAPQAKILAVKVLGNDGKGSTLNIARGILHAADLEKVRVINLSLGGQGMIKRVLKEAIDYAVAKGKLVVVAAGNDNDDATFFNPAHYENCFAVAATGQDDTRAYFSNYGSAVDVAAPGVGIFSCDSTTTSSYRKLSGTSMATPFVSGLAALLFSQKPSFTADEVKSLIQSQTDPVTTDFAVGTGRINVAKALAALSGTGGNAFPTVAITGPTTVDAGQRVDFTAIATDTDDTRVVFAWNSNATDKPQESTAGNFSSAATWNAPDVGGWYFVSCRAVDAKSGVSEHSLPVYVTPKLVTVNYLSPAKGPIGSQVSLFGNGFGTSETVGEIRFNGVLANEIVSWTTNQITVQVPLSVTSGQVIVTVQGNPSNGLYFEVDEKPPIISSVRAAEINKSSMTINWATDEEATTQVDYGPTTSYGSSTVLDALMTKNHVVTVAGLSPATTWFYRVRSRDSGGYEAITTEYSCTTLPNVAPSIVITSPTDGFTFGDGETVNIAATASDSDGTIARVEFFQGGVKLGDDAGAPYSLAWTNVPIGAYVLTAKAVDDSGAEIFSQAVTFQVHSAPTVAITSPASGTQYTSGDTVTILVNASATSGSIAKVEFYQGNTKIGETATAPYSFPWPNVPGGAFDLTARAIDDLGAGKFSIPISIRVNTPPTAVISSPGDGSYYMAGDNVTITADANDSDGSISRVDFFRNGQLLVVDTAYPYTHELGNVASGASTISARVFDNLGASAMAASITFLVGAPPSVVLIGPAGGTWYNAGTNLLLEAIASDTDGTVTRVEFYAGATLIGSDSTAPFAFTWQDLQRGEYGMRARAIDNSGSYRYSAIATITVNALPTVHLTSPTPGALFDAGQTVTLRAEPSDNDGTIGRVEFFAGETKLWEDNISPYEYPWNNLASGVYSVTARAFDNLGAAAVSPAIAFTVRAPPSVTLTSPTEGAGFNAGDLLVLAVNATDTDGTVVRVDFFDGTTLLGSDTEAPYTLSWNGLTAGRHVLTARAIDHTGLVTNSTVVPITVNAVPTVIFSSPAPTDLLHTGGTISLLASATDSDGGIARVEFYDGPTLLGQDTASPYGYDWTGYAGGGHSLVAKAVDSSGTVALSATVTITVNALPTIQITSPASGSVFPATTTIPVSVSANDSDGGIVRVEYLADGSPLASTSIAPFGIEWNPAPGTHWLQARATDLSGGMSSTEAMPVIVNLPPTVLLASPAMDITVFASTTLSLTAQAGDPDGSVAKVRFFRDGTLLGEDSSASFTWDWDNVPSGTFAIRAEAVDNHGMVTTSTARIVQAVPRPDAEFLWPFNASHAGNSKRIPLMVSASPGTVRVEYCWGTPASPILIGSSSVAPLFKYTWQPGTRTYNVWGLAYNANGDSTRFPRVGGKLLTVDSNNPTATIASPTHMASFTYNPSVPASNTITLKATVVADMGTEVTRVVFYVDGVQVGQDPSFPYTCDWTIPGVGGYVITAGAYHEDAPDLDPDNDLLTISQSNYITVD